MEGSPPRGLKRALLAAIRGYKKFVSPWMPARCRFEPTCSLYMVEAVEKWGVAKGVWLGLKRLARCHPLSRGGFDPVP